MLTTRDALGVSASATSPAFEARHLALRLAGRDVLHDVSFDVAAGQVCALMGPNGAGKSSLLRVLSGEWKPTKGELRMGGRPLGAWPTSEHARVRAVLVQDRLAGMPIRVAELIAMARQCHGPQRHTRLDEQIGSLALRLVDAVELAERVVTQLSGAEERRVQIARALAQVWPTKPGGLRLLLMDELLANLDGSSQQLALRALRRFAEWGAAIIAVLHGDSVARSYADQVVFLREGRVTAVGRPSEVLAARLVEPATRAGHA